MTKDEARKLSALTNVLVEAEREYLRAKLRPAKTFGRRDAWAFKVKAARTELNEYVRRLTV